MSHSTGEHWRRVEPGLLGESASASAHPQTAFELRLPDATAGLARFLLHLKLRDHAALASACLKGDGPRGLRILGSEPTLGSQVELVASMDAGPLPLWWGPGRVMRRKPGKDRQFELDVVVDAGSHAAGQLDAILKGTTPAKRERLEPRCPTKLRATLLSALTPTEPPAKVRVLDVGPHGAGFQCEAPPAAGTPVHVTLKRGLFAKPFPLRGIVCWSRAGLGCGVRFLLETEAERAFVADLVPTRG